MLPRLCDTPRRPPPPPRGFSNLNEDVFAMIVAFADPPDARLLAETCRVAYRLAMPRFLSDVVLGGPAVSDGPKQLIAFSTFMLADLRRVRHLRALELQEAAFVAIPEDGEDDDAASSQPGWASDFECALPLAHVLRSAPKLAHLAIWDLESLLSSQPSFADTLRALPRLRSAAFWHIGPHTMHMLKGTAALPQRLEFGAWKDGARVPGDLDALYRYAPTLESFTCHVACLLEALGPDYAAPAVREMGLGGRIPDVANLARAFPGLRRMTLFAECSVQDALPAGAWKALDHVETWLPLPVFACAVRRLDLRYALGARLPRFARSAVESRTLQLLAQTAPAVLACTLAAGIADAEVRRLAAALPKVRFLELAGTAGDAADPDERMLAWLAHFGGVPLEGVLLHHRADRPVAPLARFLKRTLPRLAHLGVARAPPGAPRGDAGRAVWYRVGADETAELLDADEGARVRERMCDLERMYDLGAGEGPASPAAFA